MTKEFLKIEPQNLPVFAYDLDADVAFVLDGMAYKLNGYFFSQITVVTNQPLKVGDVLTNNSCYYGNSSIEIIPHLHKKNELGKTDIVLEYYTGCQIDKLAINFVDTSKPVYHASCGVGRCTVFIDLCDISIGVKSRELDSRWSTLTDKEHEVLDAINKESLDADHIDYWKRRIPDFDTRLTCMGVFEHGSYCPKIVN